MKLQQWTVLVTFVGVTISLGAQAAKDYQKLDSCGSATVESGDSCSNLKVQFKFDGCQLKSEPQESKKILCSKKNAKARYQDGPYRYEVEFKKSEDGWGGNSWKQVGKVTQWQKVGPQTSEKPAKEVKSAPKEKAPAPKEAAPTSVVASTPEATVASSTSPLKYSAFFDARFTKFNAHRDPNVPNANAESGFGLEDGAFYATYEKDKLSVILDLAFRRGKDIDSNPSATVPNESSNANLGIGLDKSQLYLKYKITPDFAFDLGQFDTLFGVEVNDSKDRVFGKTGLVYDYTLPVTHTGAMLEYSYKGAYAKGFGANPNNKGTNGSGTSGDHTEFGGAIGYSNDSIRGQFGYMTRSIAKASNVGFANRTLIDGTLGTTLGAFSLDAEYSSISDPSKNSLTTTVNTDLEAAGIGYLGLASYKITEPLQVGVRYEQLKNDPSIATTTIVKAKSWGASIHYRLSPELELRSEYISYNFNGTGITSWTDSRFSVGTVVTF